jgi:rRNA maturation endonuclease Nob1
MSLQPEGQAVYDAARAERKAQAAVTMEANAAEAQKAKEAARAKGPTLGREDFHARAARIEAAMNRAVEDVEGAASVDSYDDLTNAELSDLLKERDLPHSGTKAEMVERLREDDQTSDEDTE